MNSIFLPSALPQVGFGLPDRQQEPLPIPASSPLLCPPREPVGRGGGVERMPRDGLVSPEGWQLLGLDSEFVQTEAAWLSSTH